MSPVLLLSPQPRGPVSACFGDSCARDTAPSVEQSVKAGTIEALPSASLSHVAHAKPFSSKGHWRKLTFGGRIRSLHPSKQVAPIAVQCSREDLCSAAAPWRWMPQQMVISFPLTSGLRAAVQDRVASGDSQLRVTSLRYTLLPPGGTKKSCRRKN